MAAVTITDSATDILTGLSGRSNNTQVLVYNAGSADVYLGEDADVTTSTGIPLSAGATVGMTLQPGRQLYGIVASGTVELRTLAV